MVTVWSQGNSNIPGYLPPLGQPSSDHFHICFHKPRIISAYNIILPATVFSKEMIFSDYQELKEITRVLWNKNLTSTDYKKMFLISKRFSNFPSSKKRKSGLNSIRWIKIPRFQIFSILSRIFSRFPVSYIFCCEDECENWKSSEQEEIQEYVSTPFDQNQVSCSCFTLNFLCTLPSL